MNEMIFCVFILELFIFMICMIHFVRVCRFHSVVVINSAHTCYILIANWARSIFVVVELVQSCETIITKGMTTFCDSIRFVHKANRTRDLGV